MYNEWNANTDTRNFMSEKKYIIKLKEKKKRMDNECCVCLKQKQTFFCLSHQTLYAILSVDWNENKEILKITFKCITYWNG